MRSCAAELRGGAAAEQRRGGSVETLGASESSGAVTWCRVWWAPVLWREALADAGVGGRRESPPLRSVWVSCRELERRQSRHGSCGNVRVCASRGVSVTLAPSSHTAPSVYVWALGRSCVSEVCYFSRECGAGCTVGVCQYGVLHTIGIRVMKRPPTVDLQVPHPAGRYRYRTCHV